MVSKNYLAYYQEISSMLTKDIKYVTESIKEKLIQQMLRELGTCSGCHQCVEYTSHVSLRCDITAVGTYWYHSDWLWPLTNRCTNAVFRPSALTGTARSHYLLMQSHGRWHLLALQREHANLMISFCKNDKLTTTNEDQVILWNKQLSQLNISVASTSVRHYDLLFGPKWILLLSRSVT